jgi:imidazolonepropionase-like amidohydrolase
MSAAIAFSRKGGVTTNLVVPKGGDAIFKGQAFVANLSGDFDSVEQQQHALYVELGAKSKGSRAFDLQTLIHKLEDAEKALNKKAKKKEKAKDEKEVKRSEKIINAVLKGEKPIIVDVDRATDILALLALKKRFNLDLIIAGAADAVVVAKQLANANVTVIIDAVRNLPGSFDSLHTALDSAAILDKAGVKVILSSYSAHNLSQMRFDAGIAVANGLAKEQALKAITANISDALHLDSGKIAVGKKADLVMWSADPFEISSRVEKMWINGEEKSTLSRQDALRKRYTTDSDMPRAYTK